MRALLLAHLDAVFSGLRVLPGLISGTIDTVPAGDAVSLGDAFSVGDAVPAGRPVGRVE